MIYTIKVNIGNASVRDEWEVLFTLSILKISKRGSIFMAENPIVEKINALWEEQKATLDKRDEALKKDHTAAISDLKEMLAKQDEDFKKYKAEADEEIKRLKISSAPSGDPKTREDMVKSAFFRTVHKTNYQDLPEESKSALIEAEMRAAKAYGLPKSEMEMKTLLSGIDTYGGIFVPVEVEQDILKLARDDSAIYRLAEKKTTGTSSYERPVRLSESSAVWTGEVETRRETKTPDYGQLKWDVHTLMAKPTLSSELIEDSYVDIEAELMDSTRIAFGETIAHAHVWGNGVKKPFGILAYPVAEQTGKAGVDWGKLGFAKTGKAGAFLPYDPASKDKGPADCLIDMTTFLKRGYRQGANWLMNSFTESSVRKLKDNDGNYLWQPSLQMGKPNTLLGYNIEIDENMPDIEANAFSVAFGNFRKGYLVVERRGMRIQRDTVTKAPLVIFNIDLRTGGGIQNFEAIKLLKFAA